MRRAIFSAVVLSFMAVFCGYKVDDRPWLLWTVTVADTTGAMTEATITLGPQPWATTLTEARAMGETNNEYWLGQKGVDVHWSGRDCQLGNFGAEVKLQVPGRAGIMVANRALIYWLVIVNWVLILNCWAFLPELLKMMRGEALGALTALILCVLMCGGYIAMPSLTGSAIFNDYWGFLSEVPGCTGSVTLMAQLAGVRWEGVAWLAASVGGVVGAVAVGGWQVRAMISGALRKAGWAGSEKAPGDGRG